MRRTVSRAIAATGLSVSTLVGGLTALPIAQAESPEREAAEICGQAEALGILRDTGDTRADCVDAIIGPRDADALVYIANLCRVEKIREKVHVEDRGDCVQQIRDIVQAGA